MKILKTINLEVINSFFEGKNVTSADNISLLANVGTAEEVLKFFKVNQNTGIDLNDKDGMKKRKQFLNVDNTTDNDEVGNSESRIFIVLILSILIDILEENFQIFKVILFVFLIILFCFSFYHFFISKSFNSINKEITTNKVIAKKNKISNKINIEIKVKRNSQITKINSDDLLLGDIIILGQGLIPMNGILLKGIVYVYQPHSSQEFGRKTSDNPFILSKSYILEGEGEMIACSLIEEISEDILQMYKNLKFKIDSNENSLIKFSSSYSTTDMDLKILCDSFNNTEGWEKVLEDKICKIERKTVKGSEIPITRTTALLENCNIEEVFKAIFNIDMRKKWDNNFDVFEVVESTEAFDDLYMVLKSPIAFISQRELVQRRKIYHNIPKEGCKIIHFKTVENSKCPPNNKYVRADTILSGYFLEKISETQTRICTISQTDIKGSIPKSVINSLSVKAPKDWVVNLTKGCALLKI